MTLTVTPLVACQGDPDGGDTATPRPTASTTSTTTSTATGTATVPTPAGGSLYEPGDIDTGLAPWIDDATADLAVRLSIEPAAISTIAAVLVTWPDAALGCAEPDRQYATVATDGALIELAAGGAVYRYHAGGARGPFLCPRPIVERPAPGA
jgi:hypothetical protein